MSHQDREPLVRAWSFADGEPELLGKLDLEAATCSDIDPTAEGLVFGHGQSVRLRPLDASRRAPQRILGNLRDACLGLAIFPTGDRLASSTGPARSGSGRSTGDAPAPLRILQGPTLAGEPRSVVPSEMPMLFFSVDRQGSHLAETATDSSSVLWGISDPPEAEPVLLRQPDPAQFALGDFDPTGQWLVKGNGFTIGSGLSRPPGRACSAAALEHLLDVLHGRWPVAGLLCRRRAPLSCGP